MSSECPHCIQLHQRHPLLGPTLFSAQGPLGVPWSLLTAQDQLGILAVASIDHIACHAVVGAHVSLAHAGDTQDATTQQCDPEDVEVRGPQPASWLSAHCPPHYWLVLTGGRQFAGPSHCAPKKWRAQAPTGSGTGGGQLHPVPPLQTWGVGGSGTDLGRPREQPEHPQSWSRALPQQLCPIALTPSSVPTSATSTWSPCNPTVSHL